MFIFTHTILWWCLHCPSNPVDLILYWQPFLDHLQTVQSSATPLYLNSLLQSFPSLQSFLPPYTLRKELDGGHHCQTPHLITPGSKSPSNTLINMTVPALYIAQASYKMIALSWVSMWTGRQATKEHKPTFWLTRWVCNVISEGWGLIWFNESKSVLAHFLLFWKKKSWHCSLTDFQVTIENNDSLYRDFHFFFLYMLVFPTLVR